MIAPHHPKLVITPLVTAYDGNYSCRDRKRRLEQWKQTIEISNMEKLAKKIDQLESLVASLVNLNLPPEIHVEALQSKLPEVLQGLKEGYLEAGGEKFWID